MRLSFRSIEIDDQHQLTKKTACNFMFLIQHAVLLGLKEAGRLNEMQHRQAEATLREHQRAYIRERAESLNDD